MTSLKERFVGCMLGGAVGDALGAPVEFSSREQIIARFGPDGLAEFAEAYGRVGAITDDTQMTMFTAEGMVPAVRRAMAKVRCTGAKGELASSQPAILAARAAWYR